MIRKISGTLATIAFAIWGALSIQLTRLLGDADLTSALSNGVTAVARPDQFQNVPQWLVATCCAAGVAWLAGGLFWALAPRTKPSDPTNVPG